jgi:alpha-1,2-mannosyltransferase
VRNTDRIGTATLNTNQNIAGALARLGIGEGERFVLWTLACFAVLGLTVWAVRRVLACRAARAGTYLCGDVRARGVAGVVVASLGVGAADGAGDQRGGRPPAARGLGLVAAAGIALMVWTPIPLMPEHHETSASLWRQLAGGSYVWWAIAVIAVAGTAFRAVGRSVGQPAAASGIRAGGLTAVSAFPSLMSAA